MRLLELELAEAGKTKVTVNADNIAYIRAEGSNTIIAFNFSNDSGKPFTIVVYQSEPEVLAALKKLD